jgi:GTP-binding protein Era
VPHAVDVRVDEFKVRSKDMTYIHATVIVERDSQKQILIGRGGRMIKSISQAARQQIEELVGTRVYLELWVKVLPKWRQRDQELRQLGYT